MRVLFTTPAFHPFVGGAQTFVAQMARRLAASGHEVTVLTTNARQSEDFWRPAQQPPLAWREQHDGYRIVRLALGYPPPAPYTAGILRRLSHSLGRSKVADPLRRPILRQFARFFPRLKGIQSELHTLAARAQIVHAVDASWDGLLGLAQQAAANCGTAFVVTPLIHTGSRAMQAGFVMPHQVAAYRQADWVTALSQMEADLLQKAGVSPDCCTVLRLGVDPPTPVPPSQIAAFRQQHAISGPVVAFVGAATADKGASVLARAVVRLLQQGTDVWLVYAGPEQQRLRAELARFSPEEQALLAQRMRLLGIVDEDTKATLLAACSVLALPSRVDSFGIVALEAAQYARPVVVAAVGGLQETVPPGQTGLHVPFGDSGALATALARLLQDAPLAQRLGEAGRARVQAQFTWENTFQKLLALYRKALYASHTRKATAAVRSAGGRH